MVALVVIINAVLKKENEWLERAVEHMDKWQ